MKIVKHSIGKAFDLNIPEGVVTFGYEQNDHPLVPTRDDNYVFRKEFIRDVSAFLKSSEGDALYITGPTGSGKTSGLTQVAARLNWPVQEITANGRMEMSDLVGYHGLVSPKPGETPVMQFQYGPLPLAMKNGHILLINEIDYMDPAELGGLNDVLEGRPLVIAGNGGEVVKPHPMFRVVVTGNSVGSGDESGLYQGIVMQNLAAMDRYRFVEVSYPEPETEQAILARAAPTLHEAIRTRLVSVANDVRKLFEGNEDEGSQISVTMSTRTLVRWAKLSLTFRGAPNALKYALNQALLVRARPEEQEAILRIAEDTFGDQWK